MAVAPAPHRLLAPATTTLSDDAVAGFVARACPADTHRGQRVLLIVPDNTRTAPIGLMFKTLFARLGPVTRRFDVMIALGTHPPMTDGEINERLEITPEERTTTYRGVAMLNHEWDNPGVLRELGTIPADEIRRLSGGLFAVDVPVHVNRQLFDYDRIIIVGPVFPHETAGFSGGNKYLFPGVGGPGILSFFHWLGAIETNPMVIGRKWTSVRRMIDRAGAMVTVPKFCFSLVVQDEGQLAGLFAGTPEQAWDDASELSRQLHITTKDHPFHTVLSCSPRMYTELWVAGKCMYKLEPIVADGGELILYAPHLRDVSITHDRHLRRLGYHCRDYFLKQWDRFKDESRLALTHSTQLYGLGTYDADTGVEQPRIKVTLATGLTEAECRQINLGYRDWRTIDPADYAHREDEGIFYEPKAGERLYHLRHRPAWAGGTLD